VDEAPERTLSHHILKVTRAFEFGNPAREGLANPEVARLPRDFVPELQESVGHPADDPFAGASGGVKVGPDTSRQVEAARHRRGDLPGQLYPGHDVEMDLSAGPGSARAITAPE